MSNANDAKNRASISGWDSTIMDKDAASGDVIFIYVWDMKTDWTFMMAAEFTGFMNMSERGRSLSEKEMQDVIDRTTSLITQMSTSSVHTDANKNELGLLMSLYAGKSSAWNSVEKHIPGMHFVALNYLVDAKDMRMLRPFAAMPTGNLPLEVNFLMESIKQIQINDQMKHPEWFKSH